MEILIIDDQPIYQEGLATILQRRFPFFRIKSLGRMDNIAHSYVSHFPSTDLVLFGVNTAHPNSTAMLENLFNLADGIPIIVLSAIGDCQEIKKILDLGVRGVISKYYSADEITDAITECCEGRIHVPQKVLEKIERISLMAAEQNVATSSLQLTKRQVQVLMLIEERLTNDEIAEKLFVSKATVKSHINKIYGALNASSRKTCVNRAYELGVLYRLANC